MKLRRKITRKPPGVQLALFPHLQAPAFSLIVPINPRFRGTRHATVSTSIDARSEASTEEVEAVPPPTNRGGIQGKSVDKSENALFRCVSLTAFL